MNEIKVVLADLDGTVVLPEAQSASEEVVASIREAEERGVQFSAITGRPFWMAKELLKSMGFNAPCVFEGGAIIINPTTEEVLWSKMIPVETTKEAVEILGRNASIIEYGMGVLNAEDIDISAIVEPCLSVWASVPVETADELVEELKQLEYVAVHANAGPAGDFSRTGIQVTNFEADKEHAVKELLRIIDTDKQHTLAIGDGNNDIPLFRSARLKIAMGNASELLKSEADEVVSSVDQDGFAEAIRRFTM